MHYFLMQRIECDVHVHVPVSVRILVIKGVSFLEIAKNLTICFETYIHCDEINKRCRYYTSLHCTLYCR